MGKPAARITDIHTCPMFDGPKPHVGGPIIPPCEPTVLIGGLPAARVGDFAVCAGPIDSIVQGSATVLIGGKPAARIGDMTAHGGVIVSGLVTVLIGDAGGSGISPTAPFGRSSADETDVFGNDSSAPAPQASSGKKDDATAKELLAKSPTLTSQYAELKKAGWDIKFGDAGKGSYCNKGAKTIILDKNLSNNPKELVQTLSHEIGHAKHPGGPDMSSRQNYVNSQLDDEGAATLNNIKVQREIKASGGADIGIAGNKNNDNLYNQAYDRYSKHQDSARAQREIGQIFAKGEKTSTTDESYEDYYGNSYDRMTKKQNK